MEGVPLNSSVADASSRPLYECVMRPDEPPATLVARHTEAEACGGVPISVPAQPSVAGPLSPRVSRTVGPLSPRGRNLGASPPTTAASAPGGFKGRTAVPRVAAAAPAPAPLTARGYRGSASGLAAAQCQMPLSARSYGELPRGGAVAATVPSMMPRASSQDVLAGFGGLLSPSASEATMQDLGAGNTMLSSPRVLGTSTLDPELSIFGEPIDTTRLMSPRDEAKLKLKGDKERRLRAQREAREQQREVQRLEAARRQATRERLEAEAREAKEREFEEERRRRLWDIEERKRQAELRAWEREQQLEVDVNIKLSPRLSQSNESQEERARRKQEEKIRAKEERDVAISRAREAARREKEERARKEEEERAERQRRILAVKEEKRRRDMEKARAAKEQREIKSETRQMQKQSLQETEAQKQAREHQFREQERLRRQEAAEARRLQEMRSKGERERLFQEAKELRRREKDLQDRQQMLARATVEEQVKMQFEAKEKQKEDAKRLRILEVERRQAKAEADRLAREELKKGEDERNVVYFVQPQPKGRLVRRGASPGGA